MSDGVAREGFDLDLLHGKAREDAFAYVLLKARVECKSDGKCRTTGNVFVEFEQKGRPSGIAVSTADWWAIEYDEDSWIVVPTARLKELARQCYKGGRIAVGGDRNQYRGALVPVEWLVRRLRPTRPSNGSTPAPRRTPLR